MKTLVSSHKGGVGKTLTTLHLAAYSTEVFGEGSTLAVDLDPNESSLSWAAEGERNGKPFPFPVVSPAEGAQIEDEFEYVFYDSPGRIYGDELGAVVGGADMIIAPSFPSRVNVAVLADFYFDLEEAGYDGGFGVLLTAVPRWTMRGPRTRGELEGQEVPVFEAEIKERPAFDTAGDLGLLVRDVKVRGARQAWQDYVALGREVLGR